MSDRSARDRYLQAIMNHVAEDRYPSVVQMDRIEGMLDREQLAGYVDLLIEKIADDRYPSIPMMQRIERLLTKLG